MAHSSAAQRAGCPGRWAPWGGGHPGEVGTLGSWASIPTLTEPHSLIEGRELLVPGGQVQVLGVQPESAPVLLQHLQLLPQQQKGPQLGQGRHWVAPAFQRGGGRRAARELTSESGPSDPIWLKA